jgi:hypothetical protein
MNQLAVMKLLSLRVITFAQLPAHPNQLLLPTE